MRSGVVTTTFLTKFPKRLMDAQPQEHLGKRAIARERLMKKHDGEVDEHQVAYIDEEGWFYADETRMPSMKNWPKEMKSLRKS